MNGSIYKIEPAGVSACEILIPAFVGRHNFRREKNVVWYLFTLDPRTDGCKIQGFQGIAGAGFLVASRFEGTYNFYFYTTYSFYE